MPNLFINLPTTVGNGIGAAVDVSSLGAVKSIVCAGNADATINIEVNNALVNTAGSWQSVATFQGTGSIVVAVAARWMRVRTNAYNVHQGGTTQVDMGANDDGALFVALPVPAGTGVGAAVDVSMLPAFKTVQIGGPFRGTLIVEISEDGTTEWAQPFSFQTPGTQSATLTAHWMRVRRVGVPTVNPGTPVANVGAAEPGGGGGGGGGLTISAGTRSIATGTLVFSNSNGVSFGMSGSTITASAAGAAETPFGLSAGTQSVSTGTMVFANSNGLSFGMSGSSQITGSYSQSTSPAALSAAGSSVSSGTVVFSNSNNVSFGMNGNTITASATVASTAQIPFGISGGTQSVSTGTVAFANSNGLSFGMSGSSQVTASIDAVRSISVAGGAASGSMVVLSNANGVSFGMVGNTITASVQTIGGTATGVGISAGTQLAVTGAVIFSNSNGVAFGMNLSTVTASYSQSTAPAAVSAAGSSVSSGTVVFSNSNNVSFGMNGNTITASATVAATAETPFGLSAGTQSVSTGTVAFANSNGLSFGMSGSNQITGSYTQSTAPAAVSAAGSSVSSGTVVFSNSNNVTFGMNGNTITASATVAATAETPFGLSAGTQSVSTGTLAFVNSNGLSFGMSGSNQITGSYSQSTAPAAVSAAGSSVSSGTVVFSNSNNVSFGMSGNTITASVSGAAGALALSAGTQSVSTGTMQFINANGIVWGMSGSNQITASQNFTGAIGALIAGSQQASSGTVFFVNSNGVTFGMLGSSFITASVGARVSAVESNGFGSVWAASQGTLSIQKATFGGGVSLSATQAIVLLNMAQNSQSSGAFTMSIGVYTLGGSTASLASSGSRAISWTSGSQTSDSQQYGGVSGTRYRSIPVTFNFTGGDYLIAYHLVTTNSASVTLAGKQMNIAPNADFDGIGNNEWMDGFSASSFTTALPSSIVVTDTNYARTGGGVARMPGVIYQGTF